MSEPGLRVWTWAGEEWVIAESAEDAAKVYAETGAEPMPDDEPWTMCPDDQELTWRDEDGARGVTTYGQLRAGKGRGYLGSASA